jgi:hypothetical protein
VDVNVLCPVRPHGIHRVAYVSLQNDDEMMNELLMQNAATDQEEQMMVLAALLCYREHLNNIPQRSGSRMGRRRIRIGVLS